jgi:hypothetical protein
LTLVRTLRFNERDPQKRGGFASDRALSIKIAHDLNANRSHLGGSCAKSGGDAIWLTMRT